MQRRIFLVRGEPFVAARDGFIETHGTLAALIEKHRPAAPDRSAAPETAATPAQAAPSAPETAATPAQAAPSAPETAAAALGAFEAAGAHRDEKEAPSVKPRKARTPRPKPPSAAAKVAVIAAGTAEAEGSAAGIGTAPTRTPRGRVAGRRAGEPPKPRWMTAGKARRGRLK